MLVIFLSIAIPLLLLLLMLWLCSKKTPPTPPENVKTLTHSNESKRRVAYLTMGPPAERAKATCFFLHGTPGCCIDATIGFEEADLHAAGLRVIALDRPGYGFTDDVDVNSKGGLVDAVADVLLVADAESVDTFSVCGCSGAGPAVAACAALLPPARLVGVFLGAPVCTFDDRPTPGFKDAREEGMQLGVPGARGLPPKWLMRLLLPIFGLAPPVKKLQKMDDAAFAKMMGQFFKSPSDQRLAVAHREKLIKLASTAPAATLLGYDGFFADVECVSGKVEWGFKVSDCKCDNVLVVHGADDRNVPPSHGAYYHANMAGSRHAKLPDEGHLAITFRDEKKFVRVLCELSMGTKAEW